MEPRLTIQYTDKGYVCGDHDAISFCEKTIDRFLEKKENQYVFVANSLLVDAFRLVAFQKNVPPEQLVFTFNGQQITTTSTYGLSSWPKGFCDIFQEIVSQLSKIKRKSKECL